MRRYGPDIMKEPVFRSMSHWMLQQDPPDHTRLRGLVVKAFTARRVEDMRPRIQQIVDETLDRDHPQGTDGPDRGFRVPSAGHDHLRHARNSRGASRGCSMPVRATADALLDPVPLTPDEIKQGNAGNRDGRRCISSSCSSCGGKQPGDDLTTQLVQAEEDGSKLSNEELTANIILLFGAGHETTVNLIGNGLLALHRNPDQLALLKANPALITNAIEEFLRYDSSVQMTGRVALEDIDDLGGKTNPEGRKRALPAGLGQPRPGGLSRPAGSARHHPAQCASAVVWRRHSLLPRRPAGAHRGGGRDRDPAAPAAGTDSWTTPKIRNGGRPSCCAASSGCRQAGERLLRGKPPRDAAVTSPRLSLYGDALLPALMLSVAAGGPPRDCLRAGTGSKETPCRRRCSDWRLPSSLR